MGLDNGICIKDITRKQLIPIFEYPFSQDYDGNVDICYWRKCWNIRSDILAIFPLEKSSGYRFYLNRKQVKQIRKILKWYLNNPYNWDDSYWEFSDICPHLKRDIKNLFWLNIWMIFHPDKIVYFYDSY